MSFLGDLVDNVGTALNLPELGISEALNGGQATTNTGRVGYTTSALSPLTQGAYGSALVNSGNVSGSSGSGSGSSGSGSGTTGSGNYVGSSGNGLSASGNLAAALAAYDAQLNNLDTTQSNGLSNIANGYNTSLNQLNSQEGSAQNDYNTQTQQNAQGYLNNRNSILTNTQAQANSLQRLLGMNGAGNSSASLESAPYAAALQGTQNLNDAQQTNNNNVYSLNKNWNDTQNSYNNALTNLNQQRYANENSLKSSIASTRATLLGDKDQAGGTNNYSGQISGLQSQIANLSNQYANPVMQTQGVSYSGPTLSQYTLGNTAAATAAPTAGTSDVATPFLATLAQGKQQQQGQLGY